MSKEVSFPIAKLLNEKGIIFETELYYSSETKVTSVSYNGFAAPLVVDDVVMYFYEKYDIWISVKKEYHNGALLGFEAIIDSEEGFIDVGTYAKPKQAYEAAIKHTLNNLI